MFRTFLLADFDSLSSEFQRRTKENALPLKATVNLGSVVRSPSALAVEAVKKRSSVFRTDLSGPDLFTRSHRRRYCWKISTDISDGVFQ